MKVRPFKAVRPSKERADKVAALPYDVMDSDEAREMVKDNPYSFLHVDKAEIDLPREMDQYDDQVYAKAKANIDKFLEEGTFIRDGKPNFYIYRLIMGDIEETGIVGAASVDDYMEDRIKKHEFTREAKERDRIRHVDTTNANTGPIFLTYPEKAEISALVNEWTAKTPEYDFTAEDGVRHTVWVVDEDSAIETIQKAFDEIPALYIADGHHRAASAVKVGKMRRDANPSYTGEEEFNYFLSVIFPSNQLKIMDYNRILKDLNGMTEEELLAKLSEKFEVEEYKGEGQYRPEKKHTYGLYLPGKWYKLTAKPEILQDTDVLKSLDVSVLSENVLAPIFDIKDQRTSERIDFVGGIRGLGELEKRVNEDGFAAAIALYPTDIEDLMKIADSGRVMPPKSTWFEPKLRSGLFLHELD
ncbi:DUF1015 family protein [Proteiniclasticum sp. QWL-01]|uniref:DUF1015 domain-containing protein n=1 Tax=Proteiniclasticum sp. QWL-01 TaxID=3036945 RepID=UPI0021FA3417|nr:DUF1015 family protein [Proteiniclasticum sp. QWL-01]UUM11636.1 DUF1015 family protein [Clostridiaceae bacterium HFYG-1003]WFF73114.1 DUF1015 family protein [Proteiniclasticum sp. QWL-01]